MATWVTQDHTAWWLRDTASSTWLDSNEYQADCYMNLFSFSNEDNIAWETKNTTRETALPTASAAGHPQCEFYSSSYYCQSFEHTTTTTTLPARCSSVYTDNSQCPDGTHVLVDDPASTDCDGNPCIDNSANDALCCEASCASHTCTTEGHSLKADAATTVLPATDVDRETTCCEAACEDVLPIASCSASSNFGTSTCERAYDDGLPGGTGATQWIADRSQNTGLVQSWIQLNFAQAHQVSEVKLQQRTNTYHRMYSVTFTFSDGSTSGPHELGSPSSDDGKTPPGANIDSWDTIPISPASTSTTSVKMTATTVENTLWGEERVHAGLYEIEFLGGDSC